MAIEWLEAHLAASRSALALISHDRRLLTDLTRATVWLDRGVTHRLEQGFGAFEAWRDKKLDEEEGVERHRLDRRIVNEEHWMRYGVTARRKRNMRRVGELAEMRRERRETRRSVGLANMAAQESRASGALVVEAEKISKAYEGKPIVRNFSLRIMRGDRIGIVGANGAGKTTLISLLTGALEPEAGTIRIGSNVTMARLDQKRLSLDPATTLVDALTGGGSDHVTINGERRHVIGYMKDFLFAPEQARTPIGKLSGGASAGARSCWREKALSAPSNLLVLDEPTNDLDIETLDLLQELIGEYKGTVLVVSHDRDFLDRVATSVIVSEGDRRSGSNLRAAFPIWLRRAVTGLAGPAAAGGDRQSLERPVAREPSRPSAKRKLSFNESRALEMLPDRMEALRGASSTASEKSLADADLAVREPATFQGAMERYGEVREALRESGGRMARARNAATCLLKEG